MIRIFFIYFVVLSISLSTFAKPPVTIAPQNPTDPESLAPGVVKKVLIIGGGLAGLSAALELADRGYQVTIKEKQEHIGGKLFCKPVEIFQNETFQIEHGFHAWFHNYYQFKDIRTRLQINSNFRAWPKVHFVYKNKNYKPEVIYSAGPYPLNLIGIWQRSPNLKLPDMLRSVQGLLDLIFYDFNTAYEQYDNITFAQWVKEKKVAQTLYDIIMQPALSVTLNEQESFSAAEMLTFMQIYFLSDSESDEREVTNVNFYDAVLKPWITHLINKNVIFMTNKSVNSLKIDESTLQVYGTVDADGDDETRYDAVVLASDVGNTQEIFNSTLLFYRKSLNVRKVLQNVNQSFIGRMKVAPDYKILRVWFDKKLNASAPDILETPDFTPVNLIAQYHLLEEEYASWSQRTGGSVLEFHCYTWSKHLPSNATDSQVWGYIAPTVFQIYPEIFERDFQVLSYHVNSFQNFASFEHGLNPFRPYVDTLASVNLSNIYLAGDWVRTRYPSALMERAVSTGRQAANEILIRDRVRQASLTVVNSKGPGL